MMEVIRRLKSKGNIFVDLHSVTLIQQLYQQTSLLVLFINVFEGNGKNCS